jgi:hypothetical protein
MGRYPGAGSVSPALATPGAWTAEVFSSFAADGGFSTTTNTAVHFYPAFELIGTEFVFAFANDATMPHRLAACRT